jgi:hypothetical protein
LGYNIDKNWAVELLFGYAEPYHKAANLDVDVYQYELDFLFHLLPEKILHPLFMVSQLPEDQQGFTITHGTVIMEQVLHVAIPGLKYPTTKFTTMY